MLKTITAGSLLALSLSVGMAAPALADAPDGKGNTGAETTANDGRDTGKPADPNAWGSTASNFSHILKDADSSFGEHSSGFAPGQDPDKPENGGATGRLGVGNVSPNDGAPGTRPSDHGIKQSTMVGIDPNAHPGGSR
ncbi:MAG: hypothetical protein QOJ20_5400 [Mycobacterium sp.]|nr:hypothetical protein [Mycobacterium sp.]